MGQTSPRMGWPFSFLISHFVAQDGVRKTGIPVRKTGRNPPQMDITAFRRIIEVCCIGLLWTGAGGAQPFFSEDPQAVETDLKAGDPAFGDFDNDGWPDMFYSEDWPAGKFATLLHNEGNGRFVDWRAALQTEIADQWKGFNSYVDYDNDGDLDIYLAIGHSNKDWSHLDLLLRNDRGRFVDVTQEAGLTDVLPSMHGAWLDYDQDGYLDLYVAHLDVYGREPVPFNSLYRNNGNGTFSEVTEEAGLKERLHPQTGGSFGHMVAADFNDDGWTDLYIPVFEAPNRLFINDGQGGFKDATTREIADPGQAQQTAAGDIDNDGDLDIFQLAGGGAMIDSLDFRSFMLMNLGDALFLDATEGIGLQEIAAQQAEGSGLFDIDNDGDLDLMTVWPHFLFLNDGSGIFADHTADSGISNAREGIDVMDYNLDGAVDIFFGSDSEIRGFGGLYRNHGNRNHWLQVELVGVQSNRNGIGARLRPIGCCVMWPRVRKWIL